MGKNIVLGCGNLWDYSSYYVFCAMIKGVIYGKVFYL